MSRWKVQPEAKLYFITTTIVDWQYVFTSHNYFEIITKGLTYCIAHKGLHLHAFVIMPNHAHYILSTDDGKNLSDVMRDFNTHTSREITRLLTVEKKMSLLSVFARAAEFQERGNQYKVWQDGFHPIALETEAFTMQKAEYLHANPVRKGYVELPEHWMYSSARNYILDDHSIIKVECMF